MAFASLYPSYYGYRKNSNSTSGRRVVPVVQAAPPAMGNDNRAPMEGEGVSSTFNDANPDFSPMSSTEKAGAAHDLTFNNPYMPADQGDRARKQMGTAARYAQDDIDEMTGRGAAVATEMPNAMAGTGVAYGASSYQPFNRDIYNKVAQQNRAKATAGFKPRFNTSPFGVPDVELGKAAMLETEMENAARSAKLPLTQFNQTSRGGTKVYATDPREVATARANMIAGQQADANRVLPFKDAYGNPIRQQDAIVAMNTMHMQNRVSQAQARVRAARLGRAANALGRMAQATPDPRAAAAFAQQAANLVAQAVSVESTVGGMPGAIGALQAESGQSRTFDVQEKAVEAAALKADASVRAAREAAEGRNKNIETTGEQQRKTEAEKQKGREKIAGMVTERQERIERLKKEGKIGDKTLARYSTAKSAYDTKIKNETDSEKIDKLKEEHLAELDSIIDGDTGASGAASTAPTQQQIDGAVADVRRANPTWSKEQVIAEAKKRLGVQ